MSAPNPGMGTAREPTHAIGQCLCGAVRFRVELPSKWMAHCHCSMCRRAHGAAFVTWVGFAAAQFALEAGAETLRWHASSEEARRGFCGRCGSPMFFESTRWPDEVHVARALIDSPLDRLPQAHVFHDTHVDWVSVDDALPRKPAPSPGG